MNFMHIASSDSKSKDRSIKNRAESFKKTIDTNEGYQRRMELTLSIRKQKKDQIIQKRRLGENGSVMMMDKPTEQPSSVPNFNDISRFAAQLMSHSCVLDDAIKATRVLRLFLSADNDDKPTQLVIESGALPYLVRNLHQEDETLVFESAWAITNIAAASTKYSKVVSVPEVIQPMVGLLLHSDPEIRDQAAWGLGNIAGDNIKSRDMVLNEGALGPLMKNLTKPHNMSMLQNAIWALSGFCRGRPAPKIPANDIYTLVSLIDKVQHLDDNSNALSDLFWTFSYLSDVDDEDQIELIMATGITSKLMKVLHDDGTQTIKIPIVLILENFMKGNESQMQYILDAGILDVLPSLLKSGSQRIRKHSCLIAYQIAMGTAEQVSELVRRRSVISEVIHIANYDRWLVQEEALWALRNIFIYGSSKHAKSLVHAGGLEPFVKALVEKKSLRVEILCGILESIRSVLKVGEETTDYGYTHLIEEYGGTDSIEALQEHASEAVYSRAKGIIAVFFDFEQAVDENLMPDTNHSGTFGFGISSSKQPSGNDQKFHFGNISTNST